MRQPADRNTAPEATIPDTGSGRRIRVLCVDGSIGFGGATKSMALMLRDVPGVDAVIVTSQEPDLRRFWYAQWPTYPFRRVLNYQSRWRFSEWLNRTGVPRIVRAAAMRGYVVVDALMTIVGALRIVWLIRKHNSDVVHLANGFLPHDAVLAGRLAGIPTIAHLRGFFNLGGRRVPRGAPLPTLVIGDSAAVTDSFVTGFPFTIPSTTVYEVVDVAHLDATASLRDDRRQHLQLEPDHVAIGLFGRIVEWKGQREFVLAMLDAMDNDPRLVGILVGDSSDGAESYSDSVHDIIRQSGKAGRFRLTGYVEDVEPLYAAMDVIVHASIQPEPCGMVVMEGMAARKPVIAADAGGPRELIRDGIDGRLVDPRDTTALATAILDLASDPELRSRMGDSGYQRARELFDIPVATASLRRIYERLIGLAPPDPVTEPLSEAIPV